MKARDDEPRVFTVEMANRALPLVRRIMDDLVEEHGRWKDLVARFELAAGGARADWGESPEMLALRHEIDERAEHISGFVAELDQVGVTLKGFDEGLVDFYSLHQGRVICLCWQHGETAVAHWHELDAGFAGRKPINGEFLAAQGEPAAARRS